MADVWTVCWVCRSRLGAAPGRSPLLPGVEPLFGFLPVDDVPPRAYVIGTAVLVLQIIRVLPHVQSDDGAAALHPGAVLGRGRRDLEAPALFQHPRPTARENG